MSFYDSIDLKDKIKECRQQLSALNKENVELLSSLAEYTKQTNYLRKEYNNIEHYEALEIYHAADESSSTDMNADVFEGNVKFKEMNMKMELKILNENIKYHLPKLQALARRYESQAWTTDDDLKSTSTQPSQQNSNVLTRSPAEIQHDIASYKQQHAKMNVDIQQEIDSYRSQLAAISRKIIISRREISDLISEREDYKRSAWKFRSEVVSEEGKLDYLLQQLDSTKTDIAHHHMHKDGWITAAFLIATNHQPIDDLSRVMKNRLTDVISLWLPQHHVDAEQVDDTLASCPYPYPKQPDALDYNHFVVFCKQLENSLSV